MDLTSQEAPQMAASHMFARAEAAGLATQAVTALSPVFEPSGTTREELQAEARSWADFWYAWLIAHQAARFTAALTITPATGRPSTFTLPNGGTMSTEMTMDDTATISATPEDDHGDPTSDTLTFAGSDNGTVLTLTPSGNTCTVTPVAEGTATVSVSDPAAPSLQPATFTFGPGPTSSIQGTVTVNTGGNAVPPTA